MNNKFKAMLETALQGRTQVAVAEKAGYDPHTISRWMQQTRTPNLHAFEAVLNACGYELTIKRKQQ